MLCTDGMQVQVACVNLNTISTTATIEERVSAVLASVELTVMTGVHIVCGDINLQSSTGS